jgi:hypothetical protein
VVVVPLDVKKLGFFHYNYYYITLNVFVF